MFLGLLALCSAIMLPVLWFLWWMRNINRKPTEDLYTVLELVDNNKDSNEPLLPQSIMGRFTKSTGVGTDDGIELPIMKQRAWQELASGTDLTLPISISTNDQTKPTASQAGEGQSKLRDIRVDGQEPKAEHTIGLALA
ncbi:hypothetical protein M406DRAFT_330756 [Cryphonectria parasitica EP155]|uniref:Uncharacterized protein n=1 Tax=Cryphonectria parasitica (strain ATCC 38755 / EP155) TaxID=660469 RepID=A0A9P4Y116_CRYP1|nr:uncharacterized protein M406DRAFT_330756 [Cryphonectria parasitica EP155]KAF3764412.1 hypothetical protein M406DRAFT_330756 [Cryphonectria parasitica EP155]